mmetsp:Transcript_27440/g.59943  ORF Transcript_27440/g.59943 Transcript_27440/m.59943 type:complete len:222 (+) Transcript_27440:575-1240(+)
MGHDAADAHVEPGAPRHEAAVHEQRGRPPRPRERRLHQPQQRRVVPVRPELRPSHKVREVPHHALHDAVVRVPAQVRPDEGYVDGEEGGRHEGVLELHHHRDHQPPHHQRPQVPHVVNRGREDLVHHRGDGEGVVLRFPQRPEAPRVRHVARAQRQKLAEHDVLEHQHIQRLPYKETHQQLAVLARARSGHDRLVHKAGGRGHARHEDRLDAVVVRVDPPA